MDPGGECDYRLRIRARPDQVPAVLRLRRFLKGILRGYGFVCLEVEEVPRDQPEPPTPPAAA